MALIAKQDATINGRHGASAGSSRSLALAVHRLRFVDWAPSTVTALAVSPSSDSQTRGILAVGRQNGNIELCTWLGPKPAQNSEFADRAFQSDAAGWAVHTVLPGHSNFRIEQLCFANPPTDDSTQANKLRLFSISGGSLVTEHFIPLHLAKLGACSLSGSSDDAEIASRPGNLSSLFGRKAETNVDPHYPGEIRTLPSFAGSIWSIAASATGKYLALGCEDGSVRIVDLENNRFEHLASTSGSNRRIVPRFGKAKGRIISLCWGPPVKSSSNSRPKSDSRSNKPSDADLDSSGSDNEASDEDDDMIQWHESFLVGGLGVSSAVVWEAASGNIATKLALQKNRNESTIVWSVATLLDGTIITGDSTGRVTFFDPQTRTPISDATFRAHAATSDVLALCVGPDGRTLYSAGVDQKVAEYTRMETSSGRDRWIHIASRRLHAHDVRALALDPPYSPLISAQAIAHTGKTIQTNRLPVLISGGVDFNLILTPAASPTKITKALSSTALSKIPRSQKTKQPTLNKEEQEHASINPISSNPLTTFADTTQRRVPFVPTTSRAGLIGGGSVAAVCAAKRWVLVRREKSIGIWDLGTSEELLRAARANQAGEPASAPTWYKLLEMEVTVDSNLVAVAISDNGRFLAFSDLYETKMFELKERNKAQGPIELEPKKIKSFGRAFGGEERMAPSASALRFSPDSTRIVVCSLAGAYVHVLELPSEANAESCKLLRSFGHHRRHVSSVLASDQRQFAGRAGTAASTPDIAANGHSVGTSNEAPSTKEDRTERATSTVIQHAEISADGAWLSTISSDLQHHVFSLDSLTYGRTLPSPHALPSGSVFHPATSAQFSSMLTLVFSDNKVEFWDVDSGKELIRSDEVLPAGDVSMPRKRGVQAGEGAPGAGAATTAKQALVQDLTSLKQAVQLKLANLRDFAVSAVWLGEGTTLSHYTLLLYGATWLCTARATRATMAAHSLDNISDIEMHDASHAALDNSTRKNTPAASINWVVRTTAKYQPLLLVAPLPVHDHDHHLVIIERPYFELARNLPPAFHRGTRYGS